MFFYLVFGKERRPRLLFSTVPTRDLRLSDILCTYVLKVSTLGALWYNDIIFGFNRPKTDIHSDLFIVDLGIAGETSIRPVLDFNLLKSLNFAF